MNARTVDRRAIKYPLSIAAVLIVLACPETARDSGQGARGSAEATAADERAVRSADSALSTAIEARDAERTASFYAEDALLMPIAEPTVAGRAAIQAEWAHVFGIPGFMNGARLERVEVSSGSLAYTRGTYETAMKAPNGSPVIERGKWVTIWRRQADGNWRIAVDIANTDAPPPDHAESVAGKTP
jgi:uncharacterized protein (TIGR02246 family)